MKDLTRFLIFIGISFFVFYLFNKFNKKEEKPKAATEEVSKDTTSTYIKQSEGFDKLYINDTFYLKSKDFIVKIGIDTVHGFIVLPSVRIYPYNVELLGKNGLSIGKFQNSSTYNILSNDTMFMLTFSKDSLSVDTVLFKVLPDYKLEFFTTYKNIIYSVSSGMIGTEKSGKDDYAHFRAFYKGDKFKTYRYSSIKHDTLSVKGHFKWIGLKTKYFFTALEGQDDFYADIVLSRSHKKPLIKYAKIEREGRYFLYFAPISLELLDKYGNGMGSIIDLGASWYRFISIILLKILKWLYSLTFNYGLAIILFALLIKLLFSPLSIYSQKSMRAMQLIQPRIKEIQKRHKDDPKKINEETMKLYQHYKVNPFTGCLPLLIQFPIFFALYAVLKNAIELRGSAFVFWLTDLSIKDPFYVLPILMGVASLFQTFLSSAGTASQDSKQKYFQYMFPLLIVVIFLNFPSGLQLYWLTFNILSILELLIIKRGGTIERDKRLTK